MIILVSSYSYNFSYLFILLGICRYLTFIVFDYSCNTFFMLSGIIYFILYDNLMYVLFYISFEMKLMLGYSFMHFSFIIRVFCASFGV